MALTEEEVTSFLQTTLHINIKGPDLASLLAERQPQQVLNQIIKAFNLAIPFQNISLLGCPEKHKEIPDWGEMKSAVMSKQGGLCNTNNIFMKQLLEAVGFACHLAAGTCNLAHPNNHIVTIVTGYCPGTRLDSPLLVDVGCGFPMFQAIPLNFEHTSPQYESGVVSYYLQNTGSGNYVRFYSTNFKQDLPPQSDISNGWQYDVQWERLYNFTITPQTVDYFDEPLLEVYSDRFLKKFRLLRFREDTMIALKEGRLVGQVLLLNMTKEGTSETVLESEEEVMYWATELCPGIPEALSKAAYRNWKHIHNVH